VKVLDGWIFDVYISGREVIVWVIDREGHSHCLHDHFVPAFYVGGDLKELRAVARFLINQRWDIRLSRAQQTELFLGHPIVVLQVEVLNPSLFTTIFHRVTNFKPALTYYNGDISLPQMYFFARNAFPLAFCHFAVDDDRRILALDVDDSPWALDYKLPPLKRMVIRMEGDVLNPNHGYRAPLEVETNDPFDSFQDRVHTLNGDDPQSLLERLRELLLRHDPDLIVTDWGDSFILPQLLRLSRKHKIPLPFNRDPTKTPLYRPADSYFSYGRIVYKTAAQMLFGRWHIDRHNAFLTDDYGLEGAFEIARLTQIPVQRVVRTSTGTGISAMEIAAAHRRGVLIPWHKQEPEAWKSGLDLVRTDKGGLVYQPVLGLHEDVAEIDFVSMYPSIMARFNVSPETVSCRCCPDHRVPEIGYPICRERRGLIPETVEPLIQKRVEYKKRIREMQDSPEREVYRRRQSAHKWLLVTCFGYLGYKNARFGRIEAHESVTAYGRECLLRAKEIAEKRGFRVLHANVDSLWVQKRGTRKNRPEPDSEQMPALTRNVSKDRRGNRKEEYDALLEEITRVTHIPIALEGIYRWVAFLPSRQDERMSVANRYIGIFDDGEIKMRGIEARRRDTPPFVVAAQMEMLRVLASAKSRKELTDLVPRVIEIACGYADTLRSGQVPYQDLVITKRLSRDPMAYSKDTLLAIAAKELLGSGVELSPGESIQYIVTEEHADAKCDRVRPFVHYRGREPYDVEKYTEMLLKATETVLTPLGVKYQQIEKWVKEGLGDAERIRLDLRKPQKVWLGPLFDFAERCAKEKSKQLA
jgi:DNA polymerase-2